METLVSRSGLLRFSRKFLKCHDLGLAAIDRYSGFTYALPFMWAGTIASHHGRALPTELHWRQAK